MTFHEQTHYNSRRHEAEKSHSLFECGPSKRTAEDFPQDGRSRRRHRAPDHRGLAQAPKEENKVTCVELIHRGIEMFLDKEAPRKKTK